MKRVQEIRKNSGFYALLEFNTIRTSYFIFSENHRIYFKTLKHYYSDLSIFHNNSIKRWHRQNILIKDIHNLISSTISYIDHLKQIDCTEIAKNKIIEFEREPLYNLIRALRNFLIHREPLYLSSRIDNFSTDTGEFSTLQYESFNKQSFLAYLKKRSDEPNNSKDKKALEYLKTLPEIINLNKVFEELKDLISKFHNWFVLSYLKEHKQALVTLISEIDDLNNEAAKNKLYKMYPITQGQYRYIQFLLYQLGKRG